MRKLGLILFLVLSVTIQLMAQTAIDYFHRSANLYINGNMEESLQILEQGLKKYPSDPKIQELHQKVKEEIDKEKQQQNQQQNQQQQQNQENQEQQAQQDQSKENQEQQDQQQAEQLGQKKEMSQEEAERLLNALKEDQEELQKKKAQAVAGSGRVGKDW